MILDEIQDANKRELSKIKKQLVSNDKVKQIYIVGRNSTIDKFFKDVDYVKPHPTEPNKIIIEF